MPTSSQAKIQDKERCASHNSAQWDARLDELMSSHDCTVTQLSALFQEYDAHNARVNNNGAFATSFAGMCRMLMQHLTPDSRPVEAAFLWHFLVKNLQCKPYWESGSSHEKDTIRKACGRLWRMLGKTSIHQLQGLQLADPQLLRFDALMRESFFESPLKLFIAEKSRWQAAVNLVTYSLGLSEDQNESIVENALVVASVCDAVSDITGNPAMKFSWGRAFAAFEQILHQKVPSFLLAVLKRQYTVLPKMTDHGEIAKFATETSSTWHLEDLCWCASELVHQSDRGTFWYYCTTSEGTFRGCDFDRTLDCVRQVHATLNRPHECWRKMLISFAKAHLDNSLAKLAMQVLVPLEMPVVDYGQILEPVAQQLSLNDDFTLHLPPPTSQLAEEWVLWVFRNFCTRRTRSIVNAYFSRRQTLAVASIRAMSKVALDLQSKQASTLARLCAVELDVALQGMQQERLDPMPTMIAFLDSVGDHLSDLNEEVLQLLKQGAERIPSRSWHELLSEGPGLLARDSTQVQPLMLQWLSAVATHYHEALVKQMKQSHRDPDVILQGVQNNHVQHCMQEPGLFWRFVGVVFLKGLSTHLSALTASVESGCYEISKLLPCSAEHLTLVVMAVEGYIAPSGRCDVDDTDIEIWVHFCRVVSKVTSLDLRVVAHSHLDEIRSCQADWSHIASALGCPPIDTLAFDDSFRRLLEDVQTSTQVCGWLARRNVVGALEMSQTLDSSQVSAMSCSFLEECQRRIQTYLMPMKASVPFIILSQQDGSALFEAVVNNSMSVEESVDIAAMSRQVSLAVRQLESLLKLDMNLHDAGALFRHNSRMNIEQEVEKLVTLPRFQELHEAGGLVKERVQAALELLQYSAEAKTVLDFVIQFDLIQDQEADPDFVKLKAQHSFGSKKLRDAPEEFQAYKDLFSDSRDRRVRLCANHFHVLHKMMEFPDLWTFFHDNKYAVQEGREQFDQSLARLTVELRGRDLETKLLNDVLELQQAMVPFMTQQASLRHLIDRILSYAQLGRPDFTARMDAVQDNLARIKLWFQMALTSKVESAALKAKMVNESGRIEIHLGKLRLESTTICLIMKNEGQDLPPMHGDEIEELMQQLTLKVGPASVGNVNHEQDEDSSQCKRCLEKLCAAMRVHGLAHDLELHGHPQQQARTLRFNLCDGRDALREMLSTAKELENAKKRWQDILEEARRDCSLLAAYTPWELLLIHVLLDAEFSTCKQIVETMSGRTLGACHDVDEARLELKQLASQGLWHFLRSARGLATKHGDDDLEVGALPRDHGNCPRKSLERVGGWLQRHLHPLAPAQDVGRGGDDCRQVVANLECSTTWDMLPILALWERVFRGKGRYCSARSFLWCSSETSKQDMVSFMARVEAFPLHSFVLIGINNLTPQVQELLCNYQKSLSHAHQRFGQVVYAYINMDAAPAADFLAMADKLPRRECSQLQAGMEKLRYVTEGFDVTVICGQTGCGKTTCCKAIQRSQGGTSSLPTVQFLDTLDQRRIQAALAEVSSSGNQCAVHIDVSSSAALYAVNKALIDLLLFGVWRNNEDGHMFADACAPKYVIEVPCRADELEEFFPVLAACTSSVNVTDVIESTLPFEVDGATRFVAKFLAAKAHGTINLVSDGTAPVKHEALASDEESRDHFLRLLQTYPGAMRKRLQQFVQQYLYQSFQFYEHEMSLFPYYTGVLPGQNRNRELRDLGSRLMRQKVREAFALCEQDMVCSVSMAKHSILVYDEAFALKPCWVDNDVHRAEVEPLVLEGDAELQRMPARDRCYALLAWALQLQKQEVEELASDMKFILVDDFVFKILCIHARKKAGIALILEGETGVGKTFNLQFYALLLNHRLLKKDSDVEGAPRVIWRFKTWLKESIVPTITNRQRAAEIQRQLTETEVTTDALVQLWAELLQEQRTHGQPQDVAATEAPVPLEVLLQDKIAMWLVDWKLLNPDRSIAELIEEGTPTPQSSQDLLEKFLNTPTHEVFYRILLHPDMSQAFLERYFQDVAEKAALAPSATFVVMLDELNTSSVLGFLKAVVVDRRLNGRMLPVNIFFVACINPLSDEYVVNELPASMRELKWQYPPLRGHRLEQFVEERIHQLSCRSEGTLDDLMTAAFAKMICVSQRVFSDVMGASAVSQRDIKRCLDIFDFFWGLPFLHPDETPHDKLFRCMVLAMAITYYFRIADDAIYGKGSSQIRGDYLRALLEEQLHREVRLVRVSFRDEVDRAVQALITPEHFRIPEGVALNRDLMENVFAGLVCVQTKVPTCYLGPPGRSKTLAVEVLRLNLQGSKSPKPFCRYFCAVDLIVYQCSEDSTGREIDCVLKRAADREKSYVSDGSTTRCVVFLDEGGLPQQRRMALKVLHDHLDEGNNPIIVASNSPLDAANQGRMLTVARQAQTTEQYEIMAHGLLAPSEAASAKPLGPMRCFVVGVARAFEEVCNKVNTDQQQPITNRDFVFLLRHLRAEASEANQLLPGAASLLRGLENNFLKPGVELQEVAQVFFKAVQTEFEQEQCAFRFPVPTAATYRKKMDILKDCIKGGYGKSGSRKASLRSLQPHLAPRFCMLIDSREDDAIVRCLLQEGTLPEGLEVLHVPSLSATSEDADMIAVKQMARMQHCMETGQPVLLRNAGRILTPFYNLFNQNYRIMKDELYIIVAHGARTELCKVHPDFYVVLHMPQSEYDQQPAPLKSRFAQVQISMDDVREARVEALVPHAARRMAIQSAFERCHSFVERFGMNAFVGLQPRQTVDSLCLLHLDQFVDALEGRPLPSKALSSVCSLEGKELLSPQLNGAVQVVLLHLMQIARPECVLDFSGLLGNESLYNQVYFQGQQHFSLPALLKQALDNCEETKKPPKLLIETRTSSDIKTLAAGFHGGFGAGSGLDPNLVRVLDIDSLNVSASLEEGFSALDLPAEDAKHHVIVLCIDMQGRDNAYVTYVRNLVDSASALHRRTLFALMLHYPPEVVLAGRGLCPCTFLDNWEFFFLDSVGFRTPFREDVLLQVLCAKCDAELPELLDDEVGISTIAADFARRVDLSQLLVPAPRAVDDTLAEGAQQAAKVCNPRVGTQERADALREVLRTRPAGPAIWQHLVRTFHESLKDGRFSGHLKDLARTIRTGERLMSLMDAALCDLRSHFSGIAVAVLAQLCSHDGLIELMKDTGEGTIALLRLMPIPKTMVMLPKVQIQRRVRGCVGLSPVFRLLHQQLSEHLKRLGITSCMLPGSRGREASQRYLERLVRFIEEDNTLAEFCSKVDSETLTDYARFIVQYTCRRAPASAQSVHQVLMTWVTSGTTIVDRCVTGAGSLAQLVLVAGLQGSRLCIFANLVQLLHDKFNSLELDALPAADGVDDLLAVAQLAEIWRADAEYAVCTSLVSKLWEAFLALDTLESDLAGWVDAHLHVEHSLRLAREWINVDVQEPALRQHRQIMRMSSILLELFADEAIFCRTLSARLVAAVHDNLLGRCGLVWLLQNVSDMLHNEPELQGRAVAAVLMASVDENMLWQQPEWVRAVLEALLAKTINDTWVVSKPLAMLILSTMYRHSNLPERGTVDLPAILRECLEAQGMNRPFVPLCAQLNPEEGEGMPRIAHLLFERFVREALLVHQGEARIQTLEECYMQIQRLTGPGSLKSIQHTAKCYVFSVILGRWLAAGLEDTMLDRERCTLLERAASGFLQQHVVPLVLEIRRCSDAAAQQAMMGSDVMNERLPQLRQILQGWFSQLRGEGAVLPLCLSTAHGHSPLGDLRPQFNQVRAALTASLRAQQPVALVEALQSACAPPRTDGHSKFLLLLAVYHGYYSEDKSQQLAPVLNWLQQLLPTASEEELRYFRCFIAPAQHQIGHRSAADATNDLNRMFALDCKEPMQVAIRDCLVGALALSFLAPVAQRGHFWMHASHPGDLKNHFGFGSVYTHPVSEHVHYDCGCIFDPQAGRFERATPAHWPLQAATASYVQSYGGFCLNYLVDPQMHDALNRRILTEAQIQAAAAENGHGAVRPEEQTAFYCCQRVAVSFLFLQAHVLESSAGDAGKLLTSVYELQIAKLLGGTSVLRNTYHTLEQRTAAEIEFNLIVSDVISRKGELLEAITETNAMGMCPQCPCHSQSAHKSAFEAALSQAEATPTAQVVQRFYGAHADLELVSMLPPILNLYRLIHDDINDLFLGTLPVSGDLTLFKVVDDFIDAARTSEQKKRTRQVLDAGIGAFNTLCTKLNWRIPVGACGRDDLVLEVIDERTPFLLVISSAQLDNSQDVLYRILEYLLKVRGDFLDAVKTIASEEDALASLQRVSSSSVDDMQLVHVMHTKALEDECCMSVTNFGELTLAAQQDDGYFNMDLLLPFILRTAVLGKSRWNLDEVKRNFALRSQGTFDERPRLPGCFNAKPSPQGCKEIGEVVHELRQSEICDSLAVLSGACEIVRHWPEEDAACQLAARLKDNGFSLPLHCHDAFQGTSAQMAHLGHIINVLEDHLEKRAFLFLHLPSTVRRLLPEEVKNVLDDLLEQGLQCIEHIDEVIAYFRANEELFLAQEAQPLLHVFQTTTPPEPIRDVLLAFPSEVRSRHLFQTLLCLFNIRLRVAETPCTGDVQEKWYESAEGFPAEPEAQESRGSTEGSVVLLDPQLLPDRVLEVLRDGMRRRYASLYPASTSAGIGQLGSTGVIGAFTDSDFMWQHGDDDGDMALDDWDTVSSAESYDAGSVQADAQPGQPSGADGDVRLEEQSKPNHSHRLRVSLQAATCPEEYYLTREDCADRDEQTSPENKNWVVQVQEARHPYRTPGRRLFEVVCEDCGIDASEVTRVCMVSKSGLREEDPKAPMHADLCIVPQSEMVEVDCGEGIVLSVHHKATLDVVAAYALRKRPNITGCMVVSASLQLLPRSSKLLDVGAICVVDSLNLRCWSVSLLETTWYLAYSATAQHLMQTCHEMQVGREPHHDLQCSRPLSYETGVVHLDTCMEVIMRHQEQAELVLVLTSELAKLHVDVFGRLAELEAPVTTNARQVIQWLFAQDRDHLQSGGFQQQLLQLAFSDESDVPMEETVSNIAQTPVFLTVLSQVEHLSSRVAGTKMETVKLRRGATPSSLLKKFDYGKTKVDLCLVDTNCRVLAPDVALWEKPAEYHYLRVSVATTFVIQTGQNQEKLQLGHSATLHDIHSAAQACSLVRPEDFLLWLPKNATPGGCWLRDTTVSSALLVDLQEESMVSLSGEEDYDERAHAPHFRVMSQDDPSLVALEVILRGEEERRVGVLAHGSSKMATLTEQISTLFHLAHGQFRLVMDCDGARLDPEEELKSVLDDALEGTLVLQLQRVNVRQACLLRAEVGGAYVDLQLSKGAPAHDLWRLLRWEFGMPPLAGLRTVRLGKDSNNINEGARRDFTDEEDSQVKQVLEELDVKSDEPVFMKCVDVTGVWNVCSLRHGSHKA